MMDGVPEPSFNGDVRKYPLYFLLWTIVGLFYFSQDLTQRLVSHEAIAWWRYLLAWLLGVYIWALLTPVILWLGRRFPLERRNWLSRIALQIVLSLGFAFVELALEDALLSLVHLFASAPAGSGNFFALLMARGFHGNVINYWAVLGLQWGFLYYHRYRERTQELLQIQLRASELQSQLMSARLHALKMQLQPHFLFNTLNAIAVLVRQQKSRDAELMLGRLGDLLRGVLEDSDAQEISLGRELEYLQLYLAIEQVRFADRLRVQVVADPTAQEASVPPLILQPLAENAVRHGLDRRFSAGSIEVRASTAGGMVEIQVQDDGPGLSTASFADIQGIGLTNTRSRLQQFYGELASLHIENGGGGGAVVTLKFPFRCLAGGENAIAAENADR